MAEIYLDRSLPCGPALDWMRSSIEGKEGPSAERCKQMIYDLVGADPKDAFLFTSSGAEAIASVHWTTFMEVARKDGKTHFITTGIEDASMLQSLKRLEDLGCFVKIAPLDASGKVDLVQLRELISPRTAMISISIAHGLTGVLQPIEEIAALAKEKSVLLHIDATYGLGKIANPFMYGDYLTFSGDIIHSVKGSGGAFSKAGKPLNPVIPGNKEVDTPSLIALGAAASQASLSLDTMNLEVARLRDRLEGKLPQATPLFQDGLRLPNLSVLTIPGVHQEMLQYTLQRKQLCVSVGGVRCPFLQRQLIACGVDEKVAQTAISLSLTRYSTQAEIDRAVQLIAEAIVSLRPLAEDLCN
jgi:cysteine desulfurase